MSPSPGDRARLQFLARVTEREARHLRGTDHRLFTQPFDVARAEAMATDDAFAEQVEAFVSRFGRLQDTLGDKFLPALLRALGEAPGVAIDNLDRAERLGWLESADTWLATRKLRNQMVHEYIDDPAILANAMQAGHDHVPMLISMGEALRAELDRRGWTGDHE